MDQTQGADSDLQRAIDNITNATSVDPVFSDPVAAPSSVPEGAENDSIDDAVGPFEETPILPITEEEMNAEMNQPEVPEVPEMPEMPAAEEPEMPKEPVKHDTVDVQRIKEDAIRELIPIIDRIHINPSQKFRIYHRFIETFHDYSVIEQAYNAAKDIKDDTERAESLLFVLNVIDNM